MRKYQREITNFDEILSLLDKCQTVRLGLYDGKYPYIVPLSFGWEVADGKLALYFHCAKEGKKVELLAKDNRVCIEADVLNGYVRTDHSVTADYESVIAFGHAEEIFGEEAIRGIELLLDHCHIEGYSARDCVKTGVVAVYKISVEEITGKRRFQYDGK
ncbi:MAG: pyridoxamine 5'-phosphate oxidase family protein [Clostridiales bacterium]|nr:pyridoxamine 5'-phosphate oxidase family protein [Clostridiales bacterium]